MDAIDFCDEGKRQKWIQEKNLQVFSLVNEKFGGFVIDIFAEEPFDFEAEYQRVHTAVLPGLAVELPFISKETLMEMKRFAARAIDIDDIKHLS